MKCKEQAGFMVVRIRFGHGPVVSGRRGKNRRLATLAASLLTMLSICFASLGAWRLGQDLGWAGDFAVGSGLLSHWLVWFGLAAAAQYASWRSAGYAAISPLPKSVDGASASEADRSDAAAAARV